MGERKAVTKHLALRYRSAHGRVKGQILTELVDLTGWHRDYARSALRQALKPPRPRMARPGRKPVYPADLQPSLVLCNKNDAAHVEQKNWSRVRELVGDHRYDTPRELELLNRIWDLDRVFTNYLLPQQSWSPKPATAPR